jgi:hypothetical protein
VKKWLPLTSHNIHTKIRSVVFFVSYSFVDDYNDYYYSNEVVDDDDASSLVVSVAADDYGALVTVSVLVGESFALYRLSPAKWL